jgi:hypothetical protein
VPENRRDRALFDVVAFGLGSTLSGLNDGRKKFYARVISLIFDLEAVYCGANRAFIGVDAEDAMLSPVRIHEPLQRSLGLVDAKSTLVILDLSVASGAITSQAITPAGTYLVLARALVDSLANDDWQTRVLVMLLPELFPDTDKFRRMLAPLVRERKIVLFADNGDNTVAPALQEPYSAVLAELQGEPLRNLERKLITRLGWFRREVGNGHPYLRHYFDGRHAADEIARLLMEFSWQVSPVLVVCDDAYSTWLYEPVQTWCYRANIKFARYLDVVGPEAKDYQELYRTKPVAFVTSMLHRGSTLLRKVAEVRTLLQPSHLELLSVLSDDGSGQERSICRMQDDAGVVWPINYFLQVRQEEAWLPAWRSPGALPANVESDPADEPSALLTTAEFWDLVHMCGVKPEDSVPTRRSQKRVVPDIPKMLDRYGAWLADKLWLGIKQWTRQYRQDIVLICPLAETGSTKLAQRLIQSAGARVIQIPRHSIEAVVAGKAPADILGADEPWCAELRMLAGRRVVLFDEFVLTGKTMFGMRELVIANGMTVTTTCCLLDILPSASGVVRHSLYAWQPPTRGWIPNPREPVETSGATA